MTADLPAFLLARITEDEDWARTEAEGWSGHPNDPARVLAECEAKRRIITEAVPGIESLQRSADGEWGPAGEDEPERLLRLLALPYADHPDYNQAWRP